LKRILIVEDDAAVLVGMTDFVRSLGHEVAVARDGDTALKLFETFKPDLVLLDIVLPKIRGTEVCRTIRQRGDLTPIIMVTAKGHPHDRVAGLDLGADDYVIKPFDLNELAARIRAVLRRAETKQATTESTYDFGDLKIDLAGFSILRAGQAYELAAREQEILALLLSRSGQVVTRNEILDEIWGSDAFPSTRTIDNYIVTLRKKLEADPSNPQVLISVRGAGYKFVEPSPSRD
jgi:DNA-binding response OmpR family regulator